MKNMIKVQGLEYGSYGSDDVDEVEGFEKNTRVHVVKLTLAFSSQEQALSFAPWFVRRGTRLFEGSLSGVEELAPPPVQNAVLHAGPAAEPAKRASRSTKKAEPAPPVATEPAPDMHTVHTESGEVTVRVSGGEITATLGDVVVTGEGDEDAVIANLLNAVEVRTVAQKQAEEAPKIEAAAPVVTVVPPKASSVPAPAPPASPPPAAAPAVAQEDAPPELAMATNFRGVLEWMLANGHKTVDVIVPLCAKYKDAVPAIARQPGGEEEARRRTDRGLLALVPGYASIYA
jgi:hypothetical protein